MKLYVGNLSYRSSEKDVCQAFEAFGEVASTTLILDRQTGRSRGLAFVEMPNPNEAWAAIAGLDGQEINGRVVSVSEARPM